MDKQKAFMNGIMVCALLFVVTGCSATKKKVEIHSYLKNEPRVDQELTGNRGYIMGTPKDDEGARKQTRKIFVVEVIQPPPDVPDVEVKTTTETTVPQTRVAPQPVRPQAAQESQRIVIPPIDDEPTTSVPKGMPEVRASSGAATEYVVTKDDTLQKISKKFYNTYSKWTKIYEANKEVIKNPDFLVPGTTLQIPTLK